MPSLNWLFPGCLALRTASDLAASSVPPPLSVGFAQLAASPLHLRSSPVTRGKFIYLFSCTAIRTNLQLNVKKGSEQPPQGEGGDLFFQQSSHRFSHRDDKAGGPCGPPCPCTAVLPCRDARAWAKPLAGGAQRGAARIRPSVLLRHRGGDGFARNNLARAPLA